MKDKKVAGWIRHISGKQNKKMAVLIFANVIFAVITVVFAFAIKMLINGVISGNKDKVIRGAVFLVSLVFIQFGLRILINGLSEHIQGKLEIDFKSYIFSQILKKQYGKIKEYHSGELMTRLTNDVGVVSDAIVSIVPVTVCAIVRLVCAVGALIYLDWIFAVAFSVAGLLVFLVIALLRNKLKSIHKKAQETEGKTRSFLQECIENILAIKVFSVREGIEEKSDNLQDENFRIKMKRRNYSVTGHAIYNFIFSAGYIFALIYGGIKIFNGVIGYDVLSAVLQLVNNVQVPFASLSNVIPKYYAMMASAERLMEVESIENESEDAEIDIDKVYGALKSIEIQDITFSYDDEKVLQNTSLSINKHDFVAVCGTSGIGKSTLIKLLLGVYKLDNGKMFFNTSLGELEINNTTRRLFSYVPQGNMIFSGSIKDNVCFTKTDVNEEDLKKALYVSCADEFINNLPQGVNTVVGENGLGLSEGQVQRLAIARAILFKSPIILLDEATSALDEETETKVLGRLKELEDITVIIVSHRKAMLSYCNRKIQIKNKRIIEI